MSMKRLLQRGILFLALISLVLPMAVPIVSAQSLDDFFNFGNYPVNYDQPPQIGRGSKSPDSIDNCLLRKEYFYNENHNVWVEGLERCKENSKGILSKARFEGIAEVISLEPADEQLCVQKRKNQIIVNGVPSEDEARRWSERCAYLGTVGGAGPVGSGSSSSNFSQFFNNGSSSSSRPSSTVNRNNSSGPLAPDVPITVTEDQATRSLIAKNPDFARLSEAEKDQQIQQEMARLRSTASSSGASTNFTPIYTGVGIQVPDESLVAGGISKERSLIQLIVFYTNATLPYVSVISVFVFVVAGLFYILSFTNEELNGKAKNMMIYVVIGIVIIFSAYTIVNTLLSFSTFQQ
jgi:hypothetical protein